MKAIVILLLLGLASIQAAVLSGHGSRSNLSIGYVYPGDRLLKSSTVYRYPVYNTIQYEDIVYRGSSLTRISAIHAFEIGPTQYATPWILQGGIGWSNVTVRIQSARGYGYHYRIDIWGR